MNDYMWSVVLGGFIFYFVCRVVLDVKKYIVRKIHTLVENKVKLMLAESNFEQDKKTQSFISFQTQELEKRLEQKFFNLAVSDLQQNSENMLAKSQDITQNNEVSSQPLPPAADFYQDIDRMIKVRDEIANGNQTEYQNIPEIADLAPLDAWRTVTEAITDREESLKHPASY